MEILEVLMIDDDKMICEQIKELFNDQTIKDNKIKIDYSTNFKKGSEKLKEKNYDLLILDLYEGDLDENKHRSGEDVLDQIKKPFLYQSYFSQDS